MEINFKARQVAQTRNIFKNKVTNIDLYELTWRDIGFANKLAKTIDYQRLMPNLCEYSQKRWQQIFKWSLEGVSSASHNSFMAVSDNKPCGILTYIDHGDTLELDCICDIPISTDKRANFAGSTMLCYLFKIAEELKSKYIELQAVTDAPYDNIAKYKERGFKEIGPNGIYMTMRCGKYQIKEQLKELLSKISYKPVNNSEEINLEDLTG